MALGLGSSLNTIRKTRLAGIVTDGLVLKQNFDTGAVVPISDGAAFFDGADDYISTGASNTMITGNDVTFVGWIKPGAYASAVDYLFQNQKGAGSTNFSITVHGNSASAASGYINGMVWNGSSHGHTPYDGSVDDDKWHHIAFTTTASAQVLYLNGISVATTTNTFSNASSSDVVSIGATGVNSYNYAGNACNIGIWSAALTQAQIKSIMYKNYAGLSTSEKTNLVSWWDLDVLHVDGSTVVDSHGSNNGTLT